MADRIRETWERLGNPDNVGRFDFTNTIRNSETDRAKKQNRKRWLKKRLKKHGRPVGR